MQVPIPVTITVFPSSFTEYVSPSEAVNGECIPVKIPASGTDMFRISLLRFGRRNNRDYINVCLCGCNVLLYKNLATDRAMLPLGQAGLGTGGFHRFVNDLGVTLCRNIFLLHKNRVTNRAMLSLGQTRFGTGGFDCFVDNLGVTLGGNGSRFPLPAGTDPFLFSVPGAGCRPNGCPFAERVRCGGSVSVSPGFVSDSSGSVSVSSGFVSDSAGFESDSSGSVPDSSGFESDSSGSVSVSADSEPDSSGFVPDSAGFDPDSSGSVSDSSDSLSVSEPIPDSVPWESVSAAVLRSVPDSLTASVVLSSGGFFIQDKNVPIQSSNVSNIAKTRLIRFIIQIVPSHVVIFNSF